MVSKRNIDLYYVVNSDQYFRHNSSEIFLKINQIDPLVKLTDYILTEYSRGLPRAIFLHLYTLKLVALNKRQVANMQL
jgi:hypothetical protein